MKKMIKLLVHVTFVVYLYLLYLVLFDRPYGYNVPFDEYLVYSVNIIPFKTIIEYVFALFNGTMSIGVAIENLSANLLVFMPMGVYLSYYFKNNLSLKVCTIILTLMIVLVEISQLIFRIGFFDIDDVILNVLGGIIGYLLFKSSLCQKLYNDFFSDNHI